MNDRSRSIQTKTLGVAKGVTAASVSTTALTLGGTAVTANAADLNVWDGAANGAPGFVVGAEAANAINVAMQMNKADGNPCTMRAHVFAYLSDDANGDSIVANAPDGGWAIGTDGVLIPVVAGKAAHLIAEADGDIDVTITHAAGAKTCYLIIVHPSGKISSSPAITFAA